LEDQRDQLREGLAAGGLEAILAVYLSAEHRDNPGTGCASAALLPEVARQPAETRELFAEQLAGLVAQFAETLPPQTRDPQGVALGIYAVLLIILNRKTVSVDFVVATEKTRVVWLILLSIALGALIFWLVPRLRRRHRNRRRTSEPADERSGIAGVSWKVILLAALAIYAVLLIVFNSKTVSVNFVVITEKTRVIWLVLLSVALGALIMWLLPRIRRQRKT